jgi:hypothetical protein
MKTVKGKCSLEFHPQGDRYDYHVGKPDEDVKLKHVLEFCEALNKTFGAFFGSKHRSSSWWTAPLKLDASDDLHIPIDELQAKCEAMLVKGAVTRELLGKIVKAKGLGDGLTYFETQDPFPGEFKTQGGKADDQVLKFTVEPDQTVGRIYYTDEKGKVHCIGVQNLMVNGNALVLAEEGITDSNVVVKLKVDFIVQP